MKKLAKTLLKHESLLLNWFVSKGLSSGIVEGFNNKAKLTMRKAYGFKTFENIQIACFTNSANFRNQNLPTDSADEACFSCRSALGKDCQYRSWNLGLHRRRWCEQITKAIQGTLLVCSLHASHKRGCNVASRIRFTKLFKRCNSCFCDVEFL